MTETEWLACTDPARMLEFLRGESVDVTSAASGGISEYVYPRALASDRKLRLFACILFRYLGPEGLDEENSWKIALQSAEKMADGETVVRQPELFWVDNPDVSAAVKYGLRELTLSQYPFAATLFRDIIGNLFRPVTFSRTCYECYGTGRVYLPMPPHVHVMIPVTETCPTCQGRKTWLTEPSWLSRTVLSIAQSIYDDRCFEDMPILADALEDAGCTNEEILQHCRGQERCWVCFPENRASCYRCKGSGWSSPMCPQCAGRGVVSDRLADSYIPRPCPCCDARGHVPLSHVRGCWVLDLLLGKV